MRAYSWVMTSVAEAKARLRAGMRARRAGLDPAELAAVSAAVVRRLQSLPAMVEARRVAAYRAVRGEIPLDGLLDGERRDTFTLPRVVGEDLEFVAWRDGWTFEPGAFGIPEPVGGEVVAFADHDVVLVPSPPSTGAVTGWGRAAGSTTVPWLRWPPAQPGR